MNESDRLADLAFAGAERVARHSQLKAQLAEKTHLVDDAVQVEAVAQEAHRQTQSKLAQLFLGVPVSPSTTGQMIEWRRSIAELERQRHTLLELQDDVTKLRLAEQRILPALVSISDEAGFEGAGNLPPLPWAVRWIGTSASWRSFGGKDALQRSDAPRRLTRSMTWMSKSGELG